MAVTTYQSTFALSLFTGNTQAERITDDAATLARARDYNIHDEELQAIEQAIGQYPAGTLPTGTIHGRLKDLEEGVTGGSSIQVHNLDGTSHTGTLSLSKVHVNITNVLGATINKWMTKMFGTGDLDGDGIVSVQDILAGVAINKEALDDLTLLRFDYPWQVPTGGGPGEPGGPGGGGGGLPVPGDGGGFDPGDAALPVDDIWTGLGVDVAGEYDQPVGLLVDFDTGDQHGVWRYRNAGGAELTGLQSTAGLGFADLWADAAAGDAPAGTNYGLFYFSKAQTMGITSDGDVLTNAIGDIGFEGKQVAIINTNERVALNIGDHVFDVQITPDLGANVTRSGWDGVDGVPSGFCHVINTPVGDGSVPARIIAPDTGVITIAVITSSPANNGGGAVWNVRTQYKVGRAAVTNVDINITPDAVLDTPQRDDLVIDLAVTKNDPININFMGLNTSPYGQAIILHAIIIEYTALN